MKPQRSGIYKITNMLDGKIYIGQSKDIEERWRRHKSCARNEDKKTRLYQAMRKDGLENFSFEIVELCPIEQLNEREWYYICKFKTLEEKYGYNMSTKANLQKKFTKEQVEKAQDLLKNSTLTNKEIAQMFNASHTWVSLVNKGQLWYNENLDYPLRPVISNIKKEHYCLDCGVAISRGAKRCPICAQKINSGLSKINMTSREELKDMIRKMPFSQIGNNFSVSHTTITRWCKKFNLPSKRAEINSYSDEEWEKI